MFTDQERGRERERERERKRERERERERERNKELSFSGVSLLQYTSLLRRQQHIRAGGRTIHPDMKVKQTGSDRGKIKKIIMEKK